MIVRVGPRKWRLYLSSGRYFDHATKADAIAQEHAINISKARASGHRIPRARRKRR